MKQSILVAGIALLGLASCRSLEKEPWAMVHKGTNEMVLSSGWAVYEADVLLEGESGALTGARGSAPTDLDPEYGVGLRYSRFVTDAWSVGFLAEYRSFDPDPVAPIGAVIDADAYQTWHLILASRYYFSPLGTDDRWRPFCGIDLGYIPKVELDATVDYTPLGAPVTEDISTQGDAYYTLGGLIGLSYLLQDNLALSFGVFYEYPLDSSDDSVTLNVPTMFGTVPSNVNAEVTPDGAVGFVSLSYYF